MTRKAAQSLAYLTAVAAAGIAALLVSTSTIARIATIDHKPSASTRAGTAGSNHAGGHAQQFQYAVQEYKAGRYSAAFGRFMALANQGDPDAAHVALFMNKYGPTLYGAWWDADPTDVAQWSTLIRDHRGRLQPVFVPDPYAPAARNKVASVKTSALAGRKAEASRP